MGNTTQENPGQVGRIRQQDTDGPGDAGVLPAGAGRVSSTGHTDRIDLTDRKTHTDRKDLTDRMDLTDRTDPTDRTDRTDHMDLTNRLDRTGHPGRTEPPGSGGTGSLGLGAPDPDGLLAQAVEIGRASCRERV